jgi:hypothetical protein
MKSLFAEVVFEPAEVAILIEAYDLAVVELEDEYALNYKAEIIATC